jgi:hypothetical protein
MAREGSQVEGTLQLSVLPGLSRRGARRGQIEPKHVRSELRGRGLRPPMIGWAGRGGPPSGVWPALSPGPLPPPAPRLAAVSDEPIDPGVIELAGRVFDLARGGRTEDLAGYLDAGVPVNLTTSKGDTLLVLAPYHDHADTVGLLLARGADHSRANDRGQTALAAAVFRQSTETVTRLLDAGADPDAGGPSARATAAFFQLSGMTELLHGRR